MREIKKWKKMLTYRGFCEIIFYKDETINGISNRRTINMAETQECILKELNISLREITYNLIGFFYKTGKIYSCTQTKLGKLLSILAFKYAINGKKLFNAIIYKYPPQCGTYIKELSIVVSRDIYLRDYEQDNPDNMQMIFDDFDNCIDIPTIYKTTENLDKKIECEIESLFRNFGSYPSDNLGKLLNPIVDLTVNDETNEIVLSRFLNLKKDSFNTNEENAIIEYIFS